MKAVAAIAMACVATISVASAAEQRRPVNGAQPRSATAPKALAHTGIPVPTQEQLYVPIPPCRAFNSKASTSRLMISTAARSVLVSGTAGFPAQGGRDGGCGVPESATAVVLSLTTFSGSTSSLLQVRQYGSVAPTAVEPFSILATSLSTFTVHLAEKSIALNTVSGQVHAYGDILGYFAPQIAGYMNPDGTIYSGTTRVLSSSKVGTGQYLINLDRNVATCSLSVNVAGGPFYVNGYPEGSAIRTFTWALNADAQPVYADVYHNFTVHC